MPKLPFFTADFYQLDDPGAEISQLINVYPEVLESGTGKAIGRLVGTPGLQRFVNLMETPVRGLFMGEGRMFAVGGSHFYEVWGDGYTEDYGDVGIEAGTAADPIRRVQMFVSGNEILVISAGYAWRVYADDTGNHVDHIKLIAAEYTDLAIGVKAFYYDLVIDDADNTKVTSVLRPFVAEDEGLDLVIPADVVGFTAGTYSITDVTGGVATLDSPVGTVSSTAGLGYLMDGTNTTVASPTLPFESADVGGTLVFDNPNSPGFTPGTYRISSVTDGVATLDGSPGTAGSLNGIATQYPGESAATDADGNLKAISGAYLDGYGIVVPPPQEKVLSNEFYISSAESVANKNFLKWYVLDKGTKEGYPDNLVAVLADHEELYLFGDLQSTEVWRDTGAANFPFERDMSAFMHFGLCARDSVTQLGINGIAWLAWSANRGSPQAFYAVGFQPQRISTHALENIWRTYPTVRDATAFDYIEDGHHFYVITFPSADIAWCYDLTASQQMGKPMWHARSYWDGTQHRKPRQWVHTYGYFAENTGHDGPAWTHSLSHFVGDWENGTIYVQGLYTYDEVGSLIQREIIFPHLSNENKRTVWNLFQLECKTGAAAPPVTPDGWEGTGDGNVEWTLDFSRDKGTTWLAPRTRTAIAGGGTNQRLRWWRCGESWDQVWRLRSQSQALISITAAWYQGAGADS